MRKNKLIGSVAAAMMLALAMGGFSACDGDNGHVHEYTKWAYNDTQHWKVCEADGAESTHIDHFFNAENDYKCECGAQHTHTNGSIMTSIIGRNVPTASKPAKRRTLSMMTAFANAAQRWR